MGMCTNFSKIIGTEHRVTAAYNPRTNGLTERFNRSLCDALRKHAEADPLQWHTWLPYVLISYRRRMDTITKYSSFQLMFGRSMNDFWDWKQDEKSDNVTKLYTRSLELQQLLQLFQPTAIKNIVTHPPAQSKRKATIQLCRLL
jgi:transposase InsO family protein